MHASQWSDLPLVLISDQTPEVLQLERRSVTNMLDRGHLRGIKIGKERRVSRAELLRFVEGGAVPKAQREASPMDALPSLTDQSGVLVAQIDPLDDLAAVPDAHAATREGRL